jgi:ubiquinone biosynthesis UbiH/UbiF/VisC/COQ6 family hydroxylase
MKNYNFDIIVVGGGLVGLAFILDTAKRNSKLKLAVIDNKPFVELSDDVIDNKIYAISPSNVKYLQNINVWPNENESNRIGTINKMDVFGDCGGNIILDKKTAHQPYLAKTIEYNYLQRHIIAEIANYENISIFYDKLTAIERNTSNQVNLSGQSNRYTATLLVGSDGSSSFVRHAMGVEFKAIDYNQYGVVANFITSMPHNNIARQWFINGKILAYLPMSENRISIVYSCDNKMFEMDNDAFANHISNIGNNCLGKLTLISKPEAFALKLYFIDQIWQPNIVLIGDAAHTIHPLAGQGVNLGFADAMILAKTISKIKSYQLGDSSVLNHYSKERFFAVKKMQYACHLLQRLFGIENTFIRNIRNQGLNLVNRLSWIKKILISNAI